MATATKSKTTTKTTRKPAQKAAGRKTAPKAAKPAPKPVQERTVKNIVLDSAYATVGLTDTAVEVLKSLPAKAAELREEAPVRVRTQVKTLGSLTTEAPKQLTERLQTVSAQGRTTLVGLRGQVEQQVETYAARGREVIGKVQNSAATKRALDQSRIARSQVKAAATSVRKASRAAAEAADSAAEKAGTVAS